MAAMSVDAEGMMTLGEGQSAPALTNVEVVGLLGRFHHRISFPRDWSFIILHGPNGVGKTKLLEMIYYVFSTKARVSDIPFESVRFAFSDGTRLDVANSEEAFPISEVRRAASRETSHSFVARTLSFDLRQSSGVRYEWRTPPRFGHSPELAKYLASRANLAFHAPGAWRGELGEILYEEDVIERHADLLPVRIAPSGPPPAEAERFLATIRVHLIETQRLLTSRVRTARSRVASRPLRGSRVGEYAEDLARRIRLALARYSQTSEGMDRTFPRRLLLAGIPEEPAAEVHIRERYSQQRDVRSALEDIAVVDEKEDVLLPDRELEKWERTVLWTYLDDAEAKLATLHDLLERVTLFKELINTRFKYKQMRIDRERGFVFVVGEDTEVSADRLSSGEQHELVLTYDLVFNVPRGTLVLIDEPEISLHVEWQQRFLQDVDRIAALNGLRFIVATHSPQIVHKSWSRTVALAPEVEQ